MRECNICHESKNKVYFYFDYKNKDNRSNTCMACVNARKRADKKKVLKRIKEDPRRFYGKNNLILYKRRTNTKVSQKVYNAETTPLFTQFNHLIYKHVKTKHDLSFNQLNLLMMIFPITPFPRRDFLACREIMGYKEPSLMKLFVDKGFICIWRRSQKNDRVPTLYDLTQKGKDLMSSIHKWALGSEKIPEINDNKALGLMARLYQSKKGITP